MKLSRLLAVFGLAASIGSVAIAAPTQATSLLREPSPAVSAQSSGWSNTNIVSVDAGMAGGCAIQGATEGATSGELYCWGSGFLFGETITSKTAVKVPSGDGFTNSAVTAVGVGQSHACAIEGGVLWCWGNPTFHDSNGVLGTGATGSATPKKVATNAGFDNDGASGDVVTDIGATYVNTCAIEGGEVFCWGKNNNSQVGVGSSGSAVYNTPQRVADSAPAGFQAATATQLAVGFNSSCALAASSVYCWGYSTSGIPEKLAQGDFITDNTNVIKIGGSNFHFCAIQSYLHCWGENTNGQLGDGGTTARTTPLGVTDGGELKNMGDVTAVDGGDQHTCAVESGKLFCWGKNASGQLGDGSTTSSTTPVAVAASEDGAFLNDGNVTAVSANGGGGYGHTCAIESGSVFCWGSTMDDRLGLGLVYGNQSKPVKVFVPSEPAAPQISVSPAFETGKLNVYVQKPDDGGSTITSYEYQVGEGNVETVAFSSNYQGITITGLTDGTSYSIKVRAINGIGAGPWSTAATGTPTSGSDGGGGGGGGYTSPTELGLPSVIATMTNGVISVAFTGLTQSDIESLYVKVMPTSAAFNSAAEDSYGTVGFVAGTVLPNTSALPAVANGTLTVTISQMLSLSESDGEEVITPVDIDPAGSYHLSYNISGATSSEYPNGWQIDYYGPLYNGDVQPIGVTLAAESGSDSSSGSGSSGSPSLVTSANQELLTASLGSAKIVINGELVDVDLVQASEGLRRSYGPARTFAEVQALQALADQMIAAVQDVLGSDATLPISVTKTDTGATISGLVTDPVSGESLAVPVEDVLLILNESLAIMVGGADGEGDPANIAFDGVLEFGEGGYVAVLAYGLTPGAAGEIVVMSTPELIDTFAVGADGGVLTQAQIPSDLAAGEHTVVVAVDGQSASLGFRVLPQGTLPVTGTDSSTTALLLVLVAVGSLIVLVASRRRQHQA